MRRSNSGRGGRQDTPGYRNENQRGREFGSYGTDDQYYSESGQRGYRPGQRNIGRQQVDAAEAWDWDSDEDRGRYGQDRHYSGGAGRNRGRPEQMEEFIDDGGFGRSGRDDYYENRRDSGYRGGSSGQGIGYNSGNRGETSGLQGSLYEPEQRTGENRGIGGGRYGYEGGYSGEGNYSHPSRYGGQGGMPRTGDYGTRRSQHSGYQHSEGGMQSGSQRQSFAGRGPKGYKRSDERIEEDVNEMLMHHPEIDAGEIEVKVDNGEVTLSGTVDDRHSKRLAEDIAERCNGVTEVHNQLRLQRSGMQDREVTRQTESDQGYQASSGKGTGTGGRTASRSAGDNKKESKSVSDTKSGKDNKEARADSGP